MFDHDLVPLVDGKYSVSSLSADEVRRCFPGINSVKPFTYFGEPFQNLFERFKLNSVPSISSWFDRVCHAYHYYWHEPMGRMHLYEIDVRPLKGSRGEDITNSLSFDRFPSNNNDQLIRLTFEVSPIELYRRVLNMPQIGGTLEYDHYLPDNCLAHFYQIDHSMIPHQFYNVLDIARRCTEEGVWLSRFEIQLFNLSFDHCNLIAFTRGCDSKSVLTKRFSITSWEELSQSVSVAHLARLTGHISYWNAKPNLNGLIASGAIRAVLAERFKGILDCLPFDCEFHYGVSTLTVDVDSAYLDPVLKTAYENNVMPIRPVPGVMINWQRDKSMFDAMYEMNLQGKATELHTWDEKAMIKGGIYAQ